MKLFVAKCFLDGKVRTSMNSTFTTLILKRVNSIKVISLLV